jgi:Flp pilus assembly pilin Flp
MPGAELTTRRGGGVSVGVQSRAPGRHHRLRTLRAAWRDRSGQTTTEYLMILGLLTAMIIVLTKIIVPGVAEPIVKLARHMVVFLSSV